MPDVLIQFVSDISKLQPATDALIEQGKITKENAEAFKKTNAELLKEQKALEQIGAINRKIEESGKVTKKNLADLAKIIKAQSGEFQKDIRRGVVDALHEAGVSVEEFSDALNVAAKDTSSLKQQLREMTEQLQEMKVAGKDNTEQYQLLAQKAGELKDAIGDANQEVKNFGSDTGAIDGVISLAQGITGGFAVAQGAVALFGDESEELQKTLLRVNAVMAILQGLQQVQVLLQKESAAATLANTIATKAQTAAQVIMNFVVGTSTGLLKAFRIALAATGVGLLVLGIIELVSAFKKSNDELEKANALLEQQKRLVDAYNQGVNEGVDIEIARAEAAGKMQSEIIKIQAIGLIAQKKALLESNQLLSEQQKELSNTSEEWGRLNAQILENNASINDIDNQVLIKSIQFQKKVAEEALQAVVDLAQAKLDAAKKNSAADFALQRQLERAKANLEIQSAGQNAAKIIEIRAGLNKKLREIDIAEREQRQKEVLSALETQLLEAQEKSKSINERNTQEEIDLQKKIILTKARFEADQEGLSQSQITEIRKKGVIAAAKLQKEFNKQSHKEILEDFISRNNAELSKVEITESDKLAIIEDNIIAAAQIEIEANEGLSEKIKEINAKRDRDIKEARLASIRATLEFELAQAAVDNSPQVRALQKSLQDQEKIRTASSGFERKRIEKELGVRRLSFQEQVEMIDKLASIDSAAIQKKIAALNEEKAKKLISDRDYNLAYDQLVDEQVKIVEDAELKKRNLLNQTNEEARQNAIELTQTVLDATTQIVGVLDSLFQLQSERENQSLERRKAQLEELRQAGAITEKEAVTRQKRLEADEKRIRQQQAQREKTIAVFNAAIAVPQAVLKGLATGGPILAAVYGAIALAQLLIVTSRPIPKFGKGKKNNYEGLAEVGETGTELIESNGRMYVANKPEIVWLGKNDKVFNPVETEAMLSHPGINTENIVVPAAKSNTQKIDYDKFGKAVAKHVSTTVFVDGVQEQAKKQQEFTHWLTKRRAW